MRGAWARWTVRAGSATCAREPEAQVSWEVCPVLQGRVRSHCTRGCMLACITRASWAQCAGSVPCNVVPCSGVLARLPTIGGSLESSLADALYDAIHVVQLLRFRLQHHAEHRQTGHDDLESLSLHLIGLVVEPAVLHVI